MRVSQILAYLIGAAVAAPHSGMIDTPSVRDVGVMFSESGYTGFSSFLLEKKSDNQCVPISPDGTGKPQGANVSSVMICQETACAFYTGSNCAETADENYAVVAQGPTDFETVNTPGGNHFQSYCCGSYDGTFADTADFVLKGVPHVN